MIKLIDVISFGNVEIIVMPWECPLDDFLNERPNLMNMLGFQLIEGVSFLHHHNIAHLDLKPGNLLINTDVATVPQISIIDFGISVRVTDEQANIRGYRGTLFRTALEVGSEDGPVMTYNAILANRWSCGKVLWHMISKCGSPVTIFHYTCDQLLHLDPKERLSFQHVLTNLRSQSPQSDTTLVEIPGDHVVVKLAPCVFFFSYLFLVSSLNKYRESEQMYSMHNMEEDNSMVMV